MSSTNINTSSVNLILLHLTGCPVWMNDGSREKLRRDQTTHGWRGSAGLRASSLIPRPHIKSVRRSLISTCSATLWQDLYMIPPTLLGILNELRIWVSLLKIRLGVWFSVRLRRRAHDLWHVEKQDWDTSQVSDMESNLTHFDFRLQREHQLPGPLHLG